MIRALLESGHNRAFRELERRKRLDPKFGQHRKFGMIPLFVYDRMQTGYSENKNLGVHASFGRAHTFSRELILLKDVSRGDIYAEVNKTPEARRIRGELMGVSPETFLELCSHMNYLRMYPRKVQIMPEESSMLVSGRPNSAYQAAYMFCTKDELTLKGLRTKMLPTRSFGSVGNPRLKDKSFFEMIEEEPKSGKSEGEKALDDYVEQFQAWSEMAEMGAMYGSSVDRDDRVNFDTSGLNDVIPF